MKTNEIKCTDLRIGNWVKRNLPTDMTYAKVLEIIHNGLLVQDKNGYAGCSMIFIEPIELTEEVLLKIGLYKFDEAMGIYTFENERAIVVYVLNRKLLRIEGVENDVLIDRNIRLNNVEYVHQLQNAYNLLTNEELKVEL